MAYVFPVYVVKVVFLACWPPGRLPSGPWAWKRAGREKGTNKPINRCW